MHYSKILLKPFALYTKIAPKLISNYFIKLKLTN